MNKFIIIKILCIVFILSCILCIIFLLFRCKKNNSTSGSNVITSFKYKSLLLTEQQMTESRSGVPRKDIAIKRYLNKPIQFLYCGKEMFLSVLNCINNLQNGDIAIFENYLLDPSTLLSPPNPESSFINVIEKAYKRGAKVRIMQNVNLYYFAESQSILFNNISQKYANENCHLCDNRHNSQFGTIHSKSSTFIYKSKNDIVSHIGSCDIVPWVYDSRTFHDPLRTSNLYYGWHSVCARITGPISWDIFTHLKDRFNDPAPTLTKLTLCKTATPLKLPIIPEPRTLNDPNVSTAQIVRTLSCLGATENNFYSNFAPKGEYSALFALRKILTNAKNFLYMSDQFFTFPDLEPLLTETVNRITSNGGTVIFLTNSPYGFSADLVKFLADAAGIKAPFGLTFDLFTKYLNAYRYKLFKNIINNPNIGIFQMYKVGGSELKSDDVIYTHEKIVLCDDELLTFGSAGVEIVGQTNDVEVSMFIQAPENKSAKNEIYDFRLTDWSIILQETPQTISNYKTPKEMLNLFRNTASNPNKILKPLIIQDNNFLTNKIFFNVHQPEGRCSSQIKPITKLL